MKKGTSAKKKNKRRSVCSSRFPFLHPLQIHNNQNSNSDTRQDAKLIRFKRDQRGLSKAFLNLFLLFSTQSYSRTSRDTGQTL